MRLERPHRPVRRWKLGERASLHRDGRARVEGARLGGVGVVRVAEVSVAAEPDPSSVVDAAHDGLEVVVRGGRGRMGHTPRPLHENATRSSWPHESHEHRMNPRLKMPQLK
jgi:hypothetical protein